MSALALLLILVSASMHATWNLLAKRAISPLVFIWCMLGSSSVLLLPLAAVLILRTDAMSTGLWFMLGTVMLHFPYLLFLGQGYKVADFSVIYPIARGTGPALVPVIGILFLGEDIAPAAATGIIAVIAGIYVVYWGNFNYILRDPFRLFREAGTRYALLTGVVIAAYSIWDKIGVTYVNPILYMYSLVAGSALALSPYIARKYGANAVKTEWQKNTAGIIVAGLLLFTAYGLVLFALTFSKVSYISPAREIGIVIGTILGVVVLKEPFRKMRILGSLLITLGLVLISLAR